MLAKTDGLSRGQFHQFQQKLSINCWWNWHLVDQTEANWQIKTPIEVNDNQNTTLHGWLQNSSLMLGMLKRQAQQICHYEGRNNIFHWLSSITIYICRNNIVPNVNIAYIFVDNLIWHHSPHSPISSIDICNMSNWWKCPARIWRLIWLIVTN